MKLVTFVAGGQVHWGAARGDHVIDLNLARAMFLASKGLEARYLATDVLDFIQKGEEAVDAANETLEFLGVRPVEGVVYKAEAVRWLAPIANPPKIVAVGMNYRAHRREQTDIAEPGYPVLFAKFPTSVVGWGEAIRWDPRLTRSVDFEAELGVVIGKRCTRVAAAQALDHVFGYCCLNDISARDLQYDEKGGGQWTRGKSLDTFCPIGPYIVSRDEIINPQNLGIRCLLNNAVVQEANTGDMIVGVAALIEFISQGITLVPGDIIATGTPPGVGRYRHPPLYLKSGDLIEVEVEGLGRLSNPVA